jgi:hypothetical protein
MVASANFAYGLSAMGPVDLNVCFGSIADMTP